MPLPEATESRVRSMLGGSLTPPAEPDADDPSGDAIDPEQMTLEAGSADMIAAVQAGDAGGVARAFRSMFDAMMRPSDE